MNQEQDERQIYPPPPYDHHPIRRGERKGGDEMSYRKVNILDLDKYTWAYVGQGRTHVTINQKIFSSEHHVILGREELEKLLQFLAKETEHFPQPPQPLSEGSQGRNGS